MNAKGIVKVYERRIGCSIGEVAAEICDLIKTTVKGATVVCRVKDPTTLVRKMKIKDVKDLFLIDDVYGVRILVATVESAYAVLGIIEKSFPGFLDHDYIKESKPCPSVQGKVLRLLQFVAHKNDVPFEVQITTHEFHLVNEALHDNYHRKKYDG
ncbi:MAG: hypothetical protein WCO84_01660 [bacterium]